MTLFLSTLSATPVAPGAEEARSLLRRELVRPEYHEQDVLGRILDRVSRLIDTLVGAASGTSGVTTLVAMVLLVVLVLALTLLLGRLRRTARVRAERRVVLTPERVTADELRSRAEAALEQGRAAEAVVEGFRALTLRQVERGRLEDAPGATAREVALSLGAEHPALAAEVDAGAALFAQVLYGDRPASVDQARRVLRLDDDLAVRR